MLRGNHQSEPHAESLLDSARVAQLRPGAIRQNHNNIQGLGETGAI